MNETEGNEQEAGQRRKMRRAEEVGRAAEIEGRAA
jgi:hypothetical protein